MKHNFGLKQFIGTGVVCVVAYFAAFYGIEHLRNRQGPWQVTFTVETNTPVLVINQPVLRIHDLRIRFPAATTTNESTTIAFNQARPVPFPLPSGQCVFLDTTTLPGTVALKLHGHEIQLLPRVLTIDGQERAWESDVTLSLDRR